MSFFAQKQFSSLNLGACTFDNFIFSFICYQLMLKVSTCSQKASCAKGWTWQLAWAIFKAQETFVKTISTLGCRFLTQPTWQRWLWKPSCSPQMFSILASKNWIFGAQVYFTILMKVGTKEAFYRSQVIKEVSTYSAFSTIRLTPLCLFFVFFRFLRAQME